MSERQIRPSFARARELRANLTRHEAKMWSWLKTLRAEGYRFRRQAPYRGYYLDFVCLNRMLVIELDGPSHGTEEAMKHDADRDHALMRWGFRVLRFQNQTLDEHMSSVVDAVYEALSLQPSRR